MNNRNVGDATNVVRERCGAERNLEIILAHPTLTLARSILLVEKVSSYEARHSNRHIDCLNDPYLSRPLTID